MRLICLTTFAAAGIGLASTEELFGARLDRMESSYVGIEGNPPAAGALVVAQFFRGGPGRFHRVQVGPGPGAGALKAATKRSRHHFNPKELTVDKPVPWKNQTNSRPGVGILKSTDGGRTLPAGGDADLRIRSGAPPSITSGAGKPGGFRRR
ncbi:MAG TPA: hypothetical protein VJT13_25605 [Xanthobacteraceae bacterium]|nr:hypothetical protein [Xanthobacteraceae bacterium]